MAIWTWLCRLWAWLTHRWDSPEPVARNAQLLDHFLLQLRDAYLYARNPTPGEAAVANQPIVDRIAQLLGDGTPPPDETEVRRWERAYEIERLLVYIRPRTSLAVEVDRRVDEAKRSGLVSGDKYRTQIDAISARVTAAEAAVATASNAAAAATDTDRARLQSALDQAETSLGAVRGDADAARRAVLAAVLDDLQWQYQKNVLVRGALWDSASNLLGFAIVAMIFVGVPFICFLIERWTGWTLFSMLLPDYPNYGVYTAMSFGLLGAFFSRLTSLNFSGTMTLEEAQNRYSWQSLWVRSVVGSCAALLFYFLMRSEIVSGVAPDFDQFEYSKHNMQTVLGTADVLLPSKDWSLMILWSFIAGFSEKLVPDTLSNVEAKVSGK